jgi:hypothetical protein
MGLYATLSINGTQHKCHSAQCIWRHFTECHYAEHRDYFNVILNVVMLNAVMQSVFMLNVVMLSVVALSSLSV